ncbi:MAG: response regulator transcription factor [Bacteroidales bacterium]|nr:response regulator transcription factor [Bacteroidales bacterium]
MIKTNMINILLVEDDPNLLMILQDFLELNNYKVIAAQDGVKGLSAFKKNDIHLCILDVMLPKLDGFSLAGKIRDINADIPIIFLTAKSLKEDKIKGFMHGCDDYITKPFITEELHLRIKAIIRRCSTEGFSQEEKSHEIHKIGKFTFDFDNLVLHSSFGDQTLTRKEAGLLYLLCERKNQVLTRNEAQEKVWGESGYFIGRSMDVFIVKLRRYLKEDPNVSISNIHGVGFKLNVKN